MAARSRPIERLTLRALTAADAVGNRVYGWRYNPLYQSGTIVTALLLVLLVTGLWLIFFYRVGAPYASVARITSAPWLGNWVRGVHRYASDAAVIAIAVHAIRMFAQGRSWGPRTLAWTSGVVLLLLTFVSGWTGYVMVWDTFGEVLAREGARLFDMVRARMLDGIRNQFPSWTEDQVCEEFRRRLDIQRRREERGIYQVVGFIEDGVRE